jgi:hypothetical protein
MAADKRISQLPEQSATSNNDLLIIDVAGATPSTRNIAISNFFANVARISANLLVLNQKQTPANSTITVAQGTMFFDNSYLYIATANNILKRVELTAF